MFSEESMYGKVSLANSDKKGIGRDFNSNDKMVDDLKQISGISFDGALS
jgi:hypothetical protein